MAPSQEYDDLVIAGRPLRIHYHRHPRAQRYILRLIPEGYARVTIPHRGSRREALAFVKRQQEWLEQQLEKQKFRTKALQELADGIRVLWHGEYALIRIHGDRTGGRIEFAGTILNYQNITTTRAVLEHYMQQSARIELVPRTLFLASQHQLTLNRVNIRSQRSRWGSCSSRGNLSLNWRLIQTPDSVRDYIILHELMHLREMNHSSRFWQLVASVCPGYRQAESWLRSNNSLLRDHEAGFLNVST